MLRMDTLPFLTENDFEQRIAARPGWQANVEWGADAHDDGDLWMA